MEFANVVAEAIVENVGNATIEAGSVKLFQNDFTPSPGMVLADFTEATFTGYADKDVLTMGNAFAGPDGEWKSLSPLLQFNHTGGGTANLIYGVYVTNGGSPPLVVAAERFAEPKNMETIADAIPIVLELRPRVTGVVHHVAP